MYAKTGSIIGGDDVLDGGDDSDMMIGDGGWVQASSSHIDMGEDVLNGGNGEDFLAGDAGSASANHAWINFADDVLQGGAGNDILCGDANDVTASNKGTIRGGNDTLYGGDGDDTLVGDWQERNYDPYGSLVGGDDTMTGGLGNDLFVFLRSSRADIITDFVAGAATPDVLDVTGYGIDGSNFENVLTADAYGNAVLDFEFGNTVTLVGVDPSWLHADDFVWLPGA
jgi:Ca2+-binding RTX toxin-like protein